MALFRWSGSVSVTVKFSLCSAWQGKELTRGPRMSGKVMQYVSQGLSGNLIMTLFCKISVRT